MGRLNNINGERGAITIHVSIALIALLAFSAFVIDYGSMWVSRRQAQNAADAGALAGAISLAARRRPDRDSETFRRKIFSDECHLGRCQRGRQQYRRATSGTGRRNLPCGTTKLHQGRRVP